MNTKGRQLILTVITLVVLCPFVLSFHITSMDERIKESYTNNREMFNEFANYVVSEDETIDIDKNRVSAMYGSTNIAKLRQYSDTLNTSIEEILYRLKYGSISACYENTIKFIYVSTQGQEYGLLYKNTPILPFTVTELIRIDDNWYIYMLLHP